MKQIYALACTDDIVIHFRLDEANGAVTSYEEFSRVEDASTTLFKIEVADDVIVGARQDSDEVRVLPSSGSSLASKGRLGLCSLSGAGSTQRTRKPG